ncbi:MAG: PDZ domain-containing protein [Polyangiaceae bacterium]|nr:PDZ domain-containing protein [Polyangiaceae bacterium]
MAAPLHVHLTVGVADARAQLLSVDLDVRAVGGEPLPDPLVLFMPVWAPGSYMIREFSRHVEGVRGYAGAATLRVRKARKNAWAIATGGATEVRVSYFVYAAELSVRTNHVDDTHAYWNGPATYLVPEGAQFASLQVSARMPEGWRVGTALEPTGDGTRRTYLARSLDQLLDAPFECGPMIYRSFSLLERPHEFWVWRTPAAEGVDWDRVVDHVRRILETEAALFAGDAPAGAALPYDRYGFLWHVSSKGRGGLEHADCSTLLVPPSLWRSRAGYLDVLSLVAHEFFHLWNVKRIRPAGLSPYRYEAENYTRLLWWFEGATSYYDWLVLRRAGLCTAREYADHAAHELARLHDTPGALVHSLADASFDAWVKAYRPDENAPNSTVSYYLKGEVVAALLDLEIRSRSGGQKSLDDVVRRLWSEYGRPGIPLPEDGFAPLAEAATGLRLAPLLERWVETTEPVDPAPILARFGLIHERKPQPSGPRASLGMRIRTANGRAVVESLVRHGAAMRAGLMRDDELIAVGGRRVDDGHLEVALQGLSPGSETDIVVAREGRLLNRRATLDPPQLGAGTLRLRPDASPEALTLLRAWLGDDAPSALRHL